MNDPQNRLILVTGATGKQGGAVARHLLRGGYRVRALTRNTESPEAQDVRSAGAELAAGDLDERESLVRALEGVYGAFSVQNFWETGYQREVDQGVRFAEAAHEAGVQHFVYASVGSAHRNTGLSHFESKWEIENRIRALDMPYTIFRPVYFMENWEGPFMRPSILAGTLAMPLDADTNFQQIATDDIGGFVRKAFDDREAWLHREMDLAGDERSVAGIAETFGRVIGRPVAYHQVPWAEYRAMAGEEYHDMFRWFQDVGYDADVAACRREYPDSTAFDAYLERADWQNAQPPEQPAP